MVRPRTLALIDGEAKMCEHLALRLDHARVDVVPVERDDAVHRSNRSIEERNRLPPSQRQDFLQFKTPLFWFGKLGVIANALLSTENALYTVVLSPTLLL